LTIRIVGVMKNKIAMLFFSDIADGSMKQVSLIIIFEVFPRLYENYL